MHVKLTSLIRNILIDCDLPIVDPVLRELPFEGQVGLALSNVFQIARKAKPDLGKSELKTYAEELAELIAGKVRETGRFEKVEAVKGYVNCFFKPAAFAGDLIHRIYERGADWGRGEAHGGKAMIEYSQPNTHKAFHIGHVRNLVTGATLVRCFRYAGRETLAANYYGDIGSHVFKSLWYLSRFDPDLKGAPDDPSARGKWLGEIYAKADGLLSESRELKNEVWEILKPLSMELSSIWEDDDLVRDAGVSDLIRKIALKEEDLFENRSTEEVARIIGELMDAETRLISLASERNLLKNKDAAAVLFDSLQKIRSTTEFGEIWNREFEIIETARSWYAGDEKLRNLWGVTARWSLDDFAGIYNEFGAEFDVEFFESQVEHEGLAIVEELENKAIVTGSEGAKIVEIDRQLHEKFGEKLKDKYRVLVLVRADGASLYGAKDLALAKRKFEDYGIDESIYVVGSEQAFYFQQLFQILRLMGFAQWEKCFHLSYELVMLPEGKISSRSGQVVFYDDVMSELKARALDVVSEKQPDFDDDRKKKVSGMVARGAMIYGMLRVDTNRKIDFVFDEVLDFNGRSAPYILYANARANSIFRKAAAEDIEIPGTVRLEDIPDELQPVEIDLVKLMARYPDIVQKVVKEKKPIHLAGYLYDLAVAFSDFYHKCPVLGSDPEIRTFRMHLVKAVQVTLESGLNLLGIDVPDMM